MKRWKLRPLAYIKRGLTSLFVLLVVLLPIASLAQWSHLFAGVDQRKATALPNFEQRNIDDTSQPPRLFNQPLISVTFDDGWESVYTVALPKLQHYGIPTTQYIISGTSNDPGYMNDAQIKAVMAAGHEVGSHTITHSDLTTLSNAQLQQELGQSKNALQKRLNIPAVDLASPYGHTDDRSLAYIKQYYRSHRNTVGDPKDGIDGYDVNIPEQFDRYNITAFTVRRDTTMADLQKLVQYTQAHNGWLVLTYHQIDDGPSEFGIDAQALDEQLAYLNKTPVRMVSLGEVMDTIEPLKPPEF